MYQPLSGVKPEDMKQEKWNLLDRQALGVIRLTLAKNIAFNIVNEKTTVGLMKALSDIVATYPFAGEQDEAHGCVFQRRKMRGVATNVYLWKTSEKRKETGHKEYSRFGSYIYV